MTNFVIQGENKVVNLNKNNFVVSGGEGSIYIIGNTIYKVTTPSHMISTGKIKELEKIKTKYIIVPEKVLLKDKKPHGYTMKAVPDNPISLVKILPKGYRTREGIKPEQIVKLVEKMVNGIRFIHSKGDYLQVDGNELNYMLPKTLSEVYFIDTNSYQTPTYPADAIMLSIRDWSVKQKNGQYEWTKLSDAWSFAILSFYLFTAIHPFKGRHPTTEHTNDLMTANMKAHKSVLDPQTKFPTGPIYYPFENFIPGGKNGIFWQWYYALFVKKERHYIPDNFQGKINVVFTHTVSHVSSSNQLSIKLIQQYDSDITGYYEQFNKVVVITKKYIYGENKKLEKKNNSAVVGFTDGYNTPLVVWSENNKLILQEFNGDIKQHNINCSHIISYAGRIYLQNDETISELDYVEIANNIYPLIRPIASVMQSATVMYNGVIVQNMFGTILVSIFPTKGCHHQFSISELQDYKIIDGKYCNNVLMFVGFNRKTGCYDRLIFRFSSDLQTYDCRIVKNIGIAHLNFTTTYKGVCICIDEQEELELFTNKKDDVFVKTLQDNNVKGDMYLCNSNPVKFACENKLYSISLK